MPVPSSSSASCYNPDTQLARQRLAAAQAGLEQANAAFWPRLQFQSSYTSTDNPMQAFGSILNQRAYNYNSPPNFNDLPSVDNFNARGLVTVPLYAGGKSKAGREAAKANTEASRQEAAAIRNALGFEVSRAFYSVLKTREFIRAAEAAVNSFEGGQPVEGQVMSGALPDRPTAEIGFAGRIARAFIDSKLTPLVVITSILLGAAAVIMLPREEEPQIKVPMIDVLVSMPGFSAKEVEERVTRPMEKLLWEIPGVEYIYSTSTYVIGDVAGVVESPVYAILKMNHALRALDTREFGGTGAKLKIYNAVQPFTEDRPAMKWDGEWHITIEVFRDLGTAFAAVCVLIFILMVGWFRSFIKPLVVKAANALTLVGILPAHGIMGAFFTATWMIGFMAGAGIVVRNSIILVDFIEQRLAEGLPLAQAVVDVGAVRFRPMLLTALAVIVGASVILADPIFQGLAISLMAGEIASLLISRMAVPVLYFMAYHRAAEAANAPEPELAQTVEANR